MFANYDNFHKFPDMPVNMQDVMNEQSAILSVYREGKVAPIQEIFREHKRDNLLLMGEGGIGKTTFLAHQLSILLEAHGKKPDLIPIYVELNRCPSAIGEWHSAKYGKTNYITRYVQSLIDDREIESYTSEQLIDIFSQRHSFLF